jgi:hypothetical protein
MGLSKRLELVGSFIEVVLLIGSWIISTRAFVIALLLVDSLVDFIIVVVAIVLLIGYTIVLVIDLFLVVIAWTRCTSE